MSRPGKGRPPRDGRPTFFRFACRYPTSSPKLPVRAAVALSRKRPPRASEDCFVISLSRGDVRSRLNELLSERILVLDGAMGSSLYAREPNEADYRGQRFRGHPVSLKNCTEAFVLTQPAIIEGVHRAYL